MKMKLHSLEGTVITIKSDQKEPKKCYENSLKTKIEVFAVTTQPLMKERVSQAEIARDRWPKPAENVLEREIGGKVFKLGKSQGQET